jgi:uncharacterized protein (DUF427 family)
MKPTAIDLERARASWLHRGHQRPAWAIEPGPGQESVWDYPRPPQLVADVRVVQVLYRGAIIARSLRTFRVLETASPPTFYIHPDDVRREIFIPIGGISRCEWKGSASYWSLCLDGDVIERVAWSYSSPYSEFHELQHYFAFYPNKVECYVDGSRVEPQPGSFYGGWVTADVVGPFKGDPGSESW